MNGFTLAPQCPGSDGEDTWVHETAPIWIRLYRAIEGIRSHRIYRVYVATVPVPKGRQPWSVDNKSAGTYRTLRDAISAASVS